MDRPLHRPEAAGLATALVSSARDRPYAAAGAAAAERECWQGMSWVWLLVLRLFFLAVGAYLVERLIRAPSAEQHLREASRRLAAERARGLPPDRDGEAR
jgi:hypothetical protein